MKFAFPAVVTPVLALCLSSFAHAAPRTPWYDLHTLPGIETNPPTVASEREITVLADGLLTNYKELTHSATFFDREHGWTPGLTVRASDLFRVGRVRDVYAAVEGNMSIGTIHYHGSWSDIFGDGGPFNTQTNQQRAYGLVELGRGWRFLNNRLLVIPTLQGGYGYWYRSPNSGSASDFGSQTADNYIAAYDERYRYAFMGGSVHVDYAVTSRLVGKFQGAVGSTFASRMNASDTQSAFHLGSRARWALSAAADYRLTSRLHLVTGVSYQQFGFGISKTQTDAQQNVLFEPSSRTQQLHVNAGFAYAF